MPIPMLAVPSILRAILAPLASLWRWLTEEPARLAFAVLLLLCGVLAWRLADVDGDRDKWRDRARAYEAAAARIEAVDVEAKAEADQQRETDVATIDQAEKERNDEIAKAAHGKPSDAAVRLGCERLRQAGQDTSSIAACR